MEVVRSAILFFGWPVLIAGSIFLYVQTYRFYNDVQKNVWGKLVLAMVAGWLLTMYSLGIVSTAFMMVNLREGVMFVLPIFGLWFVTMIMVVRTVLIWNKEAVNLNKFNSQLKTLVEERTQELEDEKNILEGERKKLRLVIAGIKDGVLAIDLNKNIVMGNDAIAQMSGYYIDELVGKPLFEVFKLFEKNDPINQEEVLPPFKKGYEGVLSHKTQVALLGNNTERFVEITVSQIREGMLLNVGYIILFHDITEQVNLDKMKLDFVSMAAHELRTPLTSINSYLSVLNDKKIPLTPDEQATYLQRISAASNNLRDHVENLLNITKIERKTMRLSPKSLNWVESVKGFITPLLDAAKQKDITVTVQEPQAFIPNVYADPLLTEEIISNLVQNAINFSPAGATVDITFEVKDGYVVTHITDTGEGIPLDAIPHLFTKFFRVEGTLEQGSKGTGLGLYISKAITEMHKGQIWVESQEKKGSTFSFTLPIFK